ncbi:MAG: ompA-A [Parachlamydiales bacterium]|nr:ompA-A [Parachlamydiales bacterium]
MKKIIIFLLLFRFAEASLIGNPSDPAILEEGFWISDRCFSSIRAGMAGDCLFLKRLRTCRTSHKWGISRPEMNWNLALADIGWNIRERFAIHLLAGPAAAVQYRWRSGGAAYEANSHQGMFWGGSAKLTVLEVQETTLGVDFHGGGIEWMEGPVIQNGTPESRDFTSRLYFWQIAAGLSQTVGSLRPYAGAAVQQLSCILHSVSFKHLRFHDLVQVGMYEGCSFSVGSKISLNIEARQFFESGIAVTGELRF